MPDSGCRVEYLNRISSLLKEIIPEFEHVPKRNIYSWLKFNYFKPWNEDSDGAFGIFKTLSDRRSNEERALSTVLSVIYRNTSYRYNEAIYCRIFSSDELEEDYYDEYLECCDVPLPVNEDAFKSLSTHIRRNHFLSDIAKDYGEDIEIEGVLEKEKLYRMLYDVYLELYRYIDDKWRIVNDGNLDYNNDISCCEMSSDIDEFVE